MGIVDGLLVLGIVGALCWIIYGRLRQKNLRFRNATDGLSLNLTKKVPEVIEKQDSIEQVHDEKRTMM